MYVCMYVYGGVMQHWCEFEPQSIQLTFGLISFWSNTLEKCMNPLIPPDMG